MPSECPEAEWVVIARTVMFRMNGRPRAQGCAGVASFKLAQCQRCRDRADMDVLVASPGYHYLHWLPTENTVGQQCCRPHYSTRLQKRVEDLVEFVLVSNERHVARAFNGDFFVASAVAGIGLE